jgi:hypothetical protein
MHLPLVRPSVRLAILTIPLIPPPAVVMRYPPTNCLAVDVDGTLHVQGTPQPGVVDYITQCRERGMFIILWSARGKDYAQQVAEGMQITHLFDVIIPKPGHILDDMGWGWIQYTEVIRSIDHMPNG